MEKKLSIFRDLYVRGPVSKRSELRDALINGAKAPWFFEPERSAEIRRYASEDADILVFRRAEDSACREAGLTFWSNNDGYYVPNIVPIETGKLSHNEYNAILEDFIAAIVNPVADRFGFVVDASPAEKGLDDWLPDDVALLLRRFSHLANKSTGSGHPLDGRRWLAFIVGVYRAGIDFDTDKLTRWLHEVEGWDIDLAHDLASEYERGLELLKYYDEH